MAEPALLPWLPAPPQNFRARCADIDAMSQRGNALRQLAAHALGMNDLQRLARSVALAVD